MYRPLPEYITVKSSSIEGLGLFATEPIPEGTDLGITHHILDNGELIRTPLGGFYNHSENPTCYSEIACTKARLIAFRDIEEGEEITASYVLNPLCASDYKNTNITD